jgi:hypothetical protein
MKMKNIPLLAVIGVLACIALAVFFFSIKVDTTLELTVIDSVSKAWVYNAEIKIENRFTRTFYQSDTGSKPCIFTHLAPGKFDLRIEATDYTAISIPVTITGGRNLLVAPIELVGYRIPGITEMFVYKDRDSEKLILNPRPLDADGKGIGKHPCLDMWFGIRISVQIKNGVYVQEPVSSGSERGEELFAGKLDWTWDSYPDAYYRYTCTLSKTKVKKHNAPYNVYDYIIVLPDPRKISKKEIDDAMAGIMQSVDSRSIKSTLDGFGDKVTYFISSDWNEPAL